VLGASTVSATATDSPNAWIASNTQMIAVDGEGWDNFIAGRAPNPHPYVWDSLGGANFLLLLADSWVEQTMTGLTAGTTYEISFFTARADGTSVISLVVDGEQVWALDDPPDVLGSFTATFIASCGCAIIRFQGSQALLDDISAVTCTGCAQATVAELPPCPSGVSACSASDLAQVPQTTASVAFQSSSSPAPPFPPNGIAINFQPPTMAVPAGYWADSGALFGSQPLPTSPPSSWNYGWSCDLQSLGDFRDRGNAHTRESSLVIPDRTSACELELWGLDLPNNRYIVTIGYSDPSYDTATDGCMIVDGNDNGPGPLYAGAPPSLIGADRGHNVVTRNTPTEVSLQVTITDGRLTFDGQFQRVDGRDCNSISYLTVQLA
jgi:hypothetical protein